MECIIDSYTSHLFRTEVSISKIVTGVICTPYSHHFLKFLYMPGPGRSLLVGRDIYIQRCSLHYTMT